MIKKTASRTMQRAVRRSPMEHPRHQYPHETAALQEIARSCGLTEKVKWGKPCFTLENKNIVLIQRFNDYVALMFFKGALMKDPEKLLHRIGQHMETPRQMRFTSVEEVSDLRSTIAAYIEEAIRVEQSGAKAERKKVSDLPMPEELQARLDADAALREAFAALTPGRQKGYIYQISSAKQSATRAARVEKYVPRILTGQGLLD